MMSFEGKIRWMSASITPTQLTDLKCKYKAVINSKRKYSQINTFFDLIGVLITRGLAGPDHLVILNEISLQYIGVPFNSVPDLQLNSQLKVLSFTAGQQVVCMVVNNRDLNHLENQGHSGNESFSAISSEVIEYIAREINSRQWRPFTRILNVPTGDIEEETSIADKVKKAFTIFQQNTNPTQQQPLLEVALEQINRKDILWQIKNDLVTK